MFNIALPMFLKRNGLSSKIMVLLLVGYAFLNEPIVALSIVLSMLLIYCFTSKGNLFVACLNSNILFWLITNLSSWYAWYPHTKEGLISCYTLALPFLLSAFLTSLVLLFLMESAYKYASKKFPLLNKQLTTGQREN